ncbi:MAG: hypothetical protein QW521_02805 [Desulfurococcaceae archaeon]
MKCRICGGEAISEIQPLCIDCLFKTCRPIQLQGDRLILIEEGDGVKVYALLKDVLIGRVEKKVGRDGK